MPYNSTSELPAHIRKLSAKKKRQFMHVWNSMYERTKDEGKAFAAANAAVKGKKELTVGDKSVKVTMYSGADDPDLPKHVASLPLMVRSRWVSNYNWAIQETLDDDRAEERADEYTSVSVSDLLEMSLKSGPVPDPDPDGDDSDDSDEDEDEDAMLAPRRSFMSRLKAWLSTDAPVVSPVQPVAGVSTLSVYKGSDGALRALLVYSNNFKDKQSEIIAADAHQEYVAAAEAGNALYPDLHLWHGGPATRWGTIETVSVVDGFAIAGGVVDPGKEHVALALKELADKGEIAVSFGFYGLRGPDGVYHLYRPFEISPLPAGSEANPWTSVSVGSKEYDMAFSTRKKTWLKTHFKMDDAAITDAETKFANMAASLKAAGIDFKDDDSGVGEREPREPRDPRQPTPPTPEPQPTPPAPPAPTPPQPAPPAPPAESTVYAQMTAMSDAVSGLAVAVKALQDDLATYKTGTAAAVARQAEDQVLARIAGAGGGHSPTRSTDNVQAGLKEAEDDWLAQAISGIIKVPSAGGVAVLTHANGEGAQ